MAPLKFGLFKGRSRDYQEQPSTENLLHTSHSADLAVTTPSSPIPSTSKGLMEHSSIDLSLLQIDSEDDDSIHEKTPPTRRVCSSNSLEEINSCHNESIVDISEEASTSCDVMSLQLDISVSGKPTDQCSKKSNKKILKDEKYIRDAYMWRATNVEVMQNLLSRSGTVDEQIKWEAIATARGLCTLTDSCTCPDCRRAKYLAGMADGDGGLGAAPLFSAISMGCQLQ